MQMYFVPMSPHMIVQTLSMHKSTAVGLVDNLLPHGLDQRVHMVINQLYAQGLAMSVTYL